MTAAAAPIDLAATAEFALGPIEVRPSAREVRIGEAVVTLEPRVMQVLVLLAERRGETVSRDEMLARCWGGVVVGEDAIQRCVARLRKLAEAHGGFEIETLSRVGYRLHEKSAPEAAAATPAQPQPRLAVLPFDNLSDASELAFFSDGVSEEILQAIARRSSIRVIGRTSSFQFRGSEKVVARIAEDLGATHVLDGSVRRVGDRVRVTAHLMDLDDQTLLWSDRFDGPVADVFALQEQVAAGVVAALNGVLQAGPAAAPPPEAFDLFLQARQLTMSQAIVQAREAATLLQRATALAPDFADAWALLAVAQATYRWDAADEPGARVLRRQAELSARQALRLDPRCGAAHKALYLLQPPAGAFAESEAMLEEARALNAQDSEIPWTLYLHYLSVGRLKASFAMAEEAYQSDPLRPQNVIAYANGLYTSNLRVQALALMRHAADRWRGNSVVHAIALWTAATEGDWQLVDMLSRPERLASFDEADRRMIARTVAAAEAIRHPLPAARDAVMEGLRVRAKLGRVHLSMLGLSAYLGGDLDQIYALVETLPIERLHAPDARLAPLDGLAHLFLRINARLRSDPRFVGLCRRLGLVDYWRAAGAWPDCTAETMPHYDFVAEALSAP